VNEKACLGAEIKVFEKVIVCASWSDRPFIRGNTENSCLKLVKMLSIKVQELLEILVGNVTVLKRLKEAKREYKRSFRELSLK
jgi:hypothetical protein